MHHPTTPHRARAFAVFGLIAALLLASCSSDGASTDGTSADDGPKATTSAPAGAPAAGHECDQGPATDDLQVEPVEGTPSDHTLTSDDGTEIRLHWFPVDGAGADEPAPTIVMGPGWSLAGDTDTDDEGGGLFEALAIGGMWEQGYNVLTWDPRGFGRSGGIATVNDPEKEGRDAALMLDFVAAQPEAQTDDEGDPRVGMVGFSYGGGIQLTIAGIDCRVDAIVPGIAWHSLETSLFKAETVKSGWAGILTSTVAEDRLDPHIVSASTSGLRDGTLSDEDRAWFTSRGPGDELVGQIDVPTLLIGGTVDNLFTLHEDLTNYEILRGNDVPVAMLWFCGGHGTCLTDAGDANRVADASFAWLARYLKGDTSAAALPALDLIDQDGVRWTADAWPIEGATAITAKGSGTLGLDDDSRSGGGGLDPLAGDVLGVLTESITPMAADVAIEVAVRAQDDDALLLGAPQLTFTYEGTLAEGETDGRVFAQLVDDETGLVLGNQITPIQVTLDGEEHTADVPLEVIAHHLTAGRTVTLQLVATATAYAVPHLGGSIDVTSLVIELPVAPPNAVTKR